MRLAVIVVLATAVAGCAAALLRPALSIDDYAAARVRVYRLGPQLCRVEVLTATETIQTGAALCVVVPQRIR